MKKITLALLVMLAFCLQSNAQLTEDFESGIFPPAGWAVFDNGAGTEMWEATATSNTGASAATVSWQNSGAENIDWLVSDLVDLTTSVSAELRFYAAQAFTTNYGSTYEVRVSTASQTTDTDFTTVATWDEATLSTTGAVYEEKIVDLSAYDGMSVYVAFILTNTDGDSFFVDDVTIADAPVCGAPTDIVASAITDTRLDFTWTNNPGATLGVEYEVGLAGFAPGTGAEFTAGAGIATGGTTTDILTPATDYDLYMRSNCDANGFSAWAGPISFTTLGGPGEACILPLPATVEVDCSIATPITIDFATAADIGPAGTCDATTGNIGAWFEFTAPASGSLLISNSGANNEYVILDACGGTEIVCGDMLALDLITGLTPAAVYKMAIWKDSFQTLTIDDFCLEEVLCTSAVIASATVADDCSIPRWFVEIDITTVGDATQINDGTNTYGIGGTGILQVGPFDNGDTFILTVEHADSTCDFSLGEFTFTCPPANDLFADAIAIACGDVVAGSTIGATQDESDAPEVATVETDTAADNDSPWVWYSFTGSGSPEIVTLSTCGVANTDFDTELFVYTGTSGALTLIDDGYDECGGAAENFAAETSFSSDGINTYYIAVGGYDAGDIGNFQLTVSCVLVCTADAGTLTADATPVVLSGGTVTISATPNGDIVVPTDYEVTYALTSGATLIIEAAGATPSFDVTTAGDYTIHTLVAETSDNTDPNFLELSGVVFGTTTGGDVLDIITGGGLCASLDVTGAPIVVEDPLSIGDVNEVSFTYYPNPVKNTLTLNAQNTIEQVTMYNMLGQEVLRVTPNTVDSDLDMSQLQTGTYFVKVTIANVTETIRVVKQ